MAEFDSFFIRIGGVDDDRRLACLVTVGFWNNVLKKRHNVEVPVWINADLDAPFRELRERAKAAALIHIQEAARLLGRHSADELHQAAQAGLERQEAALGAEDQASILAALRDQT